nr:hypothetical protein [uncultured Desulfuromonas sp.]
MLTLRVKHVRETQEAYEIVNKQILRPLRAITGSLIAAYGVLNALHPGREHVHVLLRAENPEALRHLDTATLTRLLAKQGQSLAAIPGAIHIKKIYANADAVHYIHENNPRRSGKGGFFFGGQRLLKKLYEQFPTSH